MNHEREAHKSRRRRPAGRSAGSGPAGEQSMSRALTVPERVIALLCGPGAAAAGRSLWKEGNVRLTRRRNEQREDAPSSSHPAVTRYEGRVKEHGIHEVAAEIDEDGSVQAECTCGDYARSGAYCRHIAALLVAVLETDGGEPEQPVRRPGMGSAESPAEVSSAPDGHAADRDRLLVGGLMEVFGRSVPRPSRAGVYAENRQELKVEWRLEWIPGAAGENLLAAGMSAGTQRPAEVRDIRGFLERIRRGERCVPTRSFRYEPVRHCFSPADDEVIRSLLGVMQDEKLYRALPAPDTGSLPIPPALWEGLLPRLAAAPSVLVERPDGTTEPFRPGAGPLPLVFRLRGDAEDGACRLEMDGLEQVVPLPAYGCALAGGRLIRLAAGGAERLAALMRLNDSAGWDGIRIAEGQTGAFMDTVVPGLSLLGRVEIDDSLARRILRTPLRARLYLDRVRERLLAGLEFQYGDYVFNPLEEQEPRQDGSPIVVRDTEAEERILALMDQEAVLRTESGFIMSGEEAEFDFLHDTVPLLEPLLEVYATTAVKERIRIPSAPPRIRMSWEDKTDWLECAFELEGIPRQEIAEVLAALEEKRRYYRLKSGALAPLTGEAFQSLLAFMNEAGVRAADLQEAAKLHLPVNALLPLAGHLQENGEFAAVVRPDAGLRRLLHEIRHPEDGADPLPSSLAPVLRDYQRTGFRWLKTLARYRFGGVLADDMGLGKTIQAIAFLLSEHRPENSSGGEEGNGKGWDAKGGKGADAREPARAAKDADNALPPSLVVAPASLVYNWLAELARFAPGLKAAVIDGSPAERERLLANADGADVLIVSYPLLRRDIRKYRGRRFHTLLLDEAQFIKNAATQTAQAVKQLSAAHRFGLTGTPVENAKEELWSIFGAVFPGLFPDKQAYHGMPREAIARKARPFLLRRLRSEVLTELPERIESVQTSVLYPEQKKLYLAYLARLQKETLKALTRDEFGVNRIRVLAGLTRLRQLCCHPALFVEGYKGGSAKFDQLLEIVEECRSAGKRALIFSQFTEMLDLIRRELARRAVPFFYLDGSTPPEERVRLSERYNRGESEFFLISLKAGGTGLNLTGADTVILYDLWWNPAVEEQAAGRAHRMGQKRVVQVIRMLAQGTVEDKMFELQQRKRDLIDALVQPGSEDLAALGEQEIRDLLSL
ncbi:DEAD/DEAH box helicase [Paenibacillus spiritus]|nr:DEAD/DEAH box helicase [Paenibacillus spiritus]